MKTLLYSIMCTLLLFPGKSNADELEKTFIDRSKTIPNPGVVVDNDEIIRFEQDINGDSESEVFLSKSSLRDGKQGNIWAVYAKSASTGKYEEVGLATFSADGFWPAKWKKDGKTYGFYSYGPAGAGKGKLHFYAIQEGKLKEVEVKAVSKENEELKELTSDAKNIEIKKSAIPK